MQCTNDISVSVCSSSSEKQVPKGLHPGRRNQQDQTDWSPHCSFSTNLTVNIWDNPSGWGSLTIQCGYPEPKGHYSLFMIQAVLMIGVLSCRSREQELCVYSLM